jgi:hypothetical protein
LVSERKTHAANRFTSRHFKMDEVSVAIEAKNGTSVEPARSAAVVAARLVY